MNAVYRRIAFTTAFLVLGAYGYVTLRGPQGVPALLEKRREIRRLEEENASLARENEMKRDRLRKIEESPSEKDLLVREKLRMLRPNETEFILPHATRRPPGPGQ